jgi:hypothetical protein
MVAVNPNQIFLFILSISLTSLHVSARVGPSSGEHYRFFFLVQLSVWDCRFLARKAMESMSKKYREATI